MPSSFIAIVVIHNPVKSPQVLLSQLDIMSTYLFGWSAQRTLVFICASSACWRLNNGLLYFLGCYQAVSPFHRLSTCYTAQDLSLRYTDKEHTAKEKCAIHWAQQEHSHPADQDIDWAVADSVSGFLFVIYSASPRSVTLQSLYFIYWYVSFPPPTGSLHFPYHWFWLTFDYT